MKGHILQRSTSQGSIGSPIYNRHCYTPTMSRSPQHFHRPGETQLLPSTGQLHYGYENLTHNEKKKKKKWQENMQMLALENLLYSLCLL